MAPGFGGGLDIGGREDGSKIRNNERHFFLEFLCYRLKLAAGRAADVRRREEDDWAEPIKRGTIISMMDDDR